MTIKLIVGLQNPGATYTDTRHNAGGWFAGQLAEHLRIPFKPEKKLHGALAVLTRDGHTCRILLPDTFMNHSGQAVRAVSQFYRIAPTEILVAHDELDLPNGRIKLKSGGGHGGHNGLRDIVSQLGSSDFHRLRIGIGHPGHKDLVLQYVLGKAPLADRQSIDEAITRAFGVVPELLAGDVAAAMNRLNS